MEAKKTIWIGVGALALILLTAGASAMITRAAIEEPVAEKVTKTETRHHYNRRDNEITWNEPRHAQPAPQQARTCDDHNVVGILIGGAAGGLAGNQVGSGKGQDLATIGGALGGAYLGQRYIPTRGVVCP